MLVEAATLPKPSKEFKKFCNSLRCPLCGAQLDGNIHPKQANLYCRQNNEEYTCMWYPDKSEPEHEQIMYWYAEYEYAINVAKGTSDFFTWIDRYNRDVKAIYRHMTRKRIFEYDGPRLLIFRQRMEEQQFLKKLKTYNVFS